MANEIRLRSNNVSGTITDNPLLIGSTTINSPGFVDLPTVTGLNHLILILDPLEIGGPAEIVTVTAHSAAASSVTAIRGAEGSAARQHAIGTTWFHGPVVSDYNYTQRTALSTNRPTSPFNGELVYETDTNRWTARSSSNVWLPSPHNPPRCRVFHTAGVSVANNALTRLGVTAGTTAVFNSERYDTDSMHDTVTNPGRITFNTPGLYRVGAHITLGAGPYTLAELFIQLNGTTFIAPGYQGFSQDANDNVYLSGNTDYVFAVGDFIEIILFQISTASRTTAGSSATLQIGMEFFATWVGA